ncbi:hypothetical protein B879_01249 [Cecembia lonarensis LW9]|uniref:Uncharacterized protein n=2 Tax=Cecembia TaxID=1187078 RepID=K1L119_CECL9|nr:hypothetical protein B879_01249 [Cecembia lonarensis LW9]
MPTLKAIHICNYSRIFDLFLEFVNFVSHQPTLQPKIAKEYVFANADRNTYKRMKIKAKEEHRTHNSVYVAIAGDVVNRRSVLLRNFVLNGKGSASNPLLNIHADRV